MIIQDAQTHSSVAFRNCDDLLGQSGPTCNSWCIRARLLSRAMGNVITPEEQTQRLKPTLSSALCGTARHG
jgi:hypothetical protein